MFSQEFKYNVALLGNEDYSLDSPSILGKSRNNQTNQYNYNSNSNNSMNQSIKKSVNYDTKTRVNHHKYNTNSSNYIRKPLYKHKRLSSHDFIDSQTHLSISRGDRIGELLLNGRNDRLGISVVNKRSQSPNETRLSSIQFIDKSQDCKHSSISFVKNQEIKDRDRNVAQERNEDNGSRDFDEYNKNKTSSLKYYYKNQYREKSCIIYPDASDDQSNFPERSYTKSHDRKNSYLYDEKDDKYSRVDYENESRVDYNSRIDRPVTKLNTTSNTLKKNSLIVNKDSMKNELLHGLFEEFNEKYLKNIKNYRGCLDSDLKVPQYSEFIKKIKYNEEVPGVKSKTTKAVGKVEKSKINTIAKQASIALKKETKSNKIADFSFIKHKKDSSSTITTVSKCSEGKTADISRVEKLKVMLAKKYDSTNPVVKPSKMNRLGNGNVKTNKIKPLEEKKENLEPKTVKFNEDEIKLKEPEKVPHVVSIIKKEKNAHFFQFMQGKREEKEDENGEENEKTEDEEDDNYSDESIIDFSENAVPDVQTIKEDKEVTETQTTKVFIEEKVLQAKQKTPIMKISRQLKEEESDVIDFNEFGEFNEYLSNFNTEAANTSFFQNPSKNNSIKKLINIGVNKEATAHHKGSHSRSPSVDIPKLNFSSIQDDHSKEAIKVIHNKRSISLAEFNYLEEIEKLQQNSNTSQTPQNTKNKSFDLFNHFFYRDDFNDKGKKDQAMGKLSVIENKSINEAKIIKEPDANGITSSTIDLISFPKIPGISTITTEEKEKHLNLCLKGTESNGTRPEPNELSNKQLDEQADKIKEIIERKKNGKIANIINNNIESRFTNISIPNESCFDHSIYLKSNKQADLSPIIPDQVVNFDDFQSDGNEELKAELEFVKQGAHRKEKGYKEVILNLLHLLKTMKLDTKTAESLFEELIDVKKLGKGVVLKSELEVLFKCVWEDAELKSKIDQQETFFDERKNDLNNVSNSSICLKSTSKTTSNNIYKRKKRSLSTAGIDNLSLVADITSNPPESKKNADDEDPFKDICKGKVTPIPQDEQIEDTDDKDDSIYQEYLSFKSQDFNEYKGSIPLKYQVTKKLVNEETASNGQAIKYFDNGIKEIHYKNNNFTRFFPDGYSLNFFPNKDVKQNFLDGRTIYFFFKNKTYEFFYPREGLTVYLFDNGQVEKHFSDGRTFIKFPDGLVKVIRPNGEAINELNSRLLQKKDKTGKIKLINY